MCDESCTWSASWAARVSKYSTKNWFVACIDNDKQNKSENNISSVLNCLQMRYLWCATSIAHFKNVTVFATSTRELIDIDPKKKKKKVLIREMLADQLLCKWTSRTTVIVCVTNFIITFFNKYFVFSYLMMKIVPVFSSSGLSLSPLFFFVSLIKKYN